MRFKEHGLRSTSCITAFCYKWVNRILNSSVHWLVIGGLWISTAYAQQPTDPNPPGTTNAGYVQGVGPGYWPSMGTGAMPTLNIGPGTAFCNASVNEYVGGALTLTPSTTNYVYLDPSNNCVPTFNTTEFLPWHIPIARAVTGATTITTLTDVRNWFHPTQPNNTRYADQFPGANAGEKIKNCINALPDTIGGICDARGFQGTQTIDIVDPTLTVGSATKPVTLLLGAATFNTTKPITMGKGSQMIGVGKATVLSSMITSNACSLTSTPCATIMVASERVVLRDFKLVYAGTTGTCEAGSTTCSIGIDIGVGPSGAVGHHITVRNVEVTRPDSAGASTPGFSIGIRMQKTFYGGFYDVDAHTNGDYNLLVSNTSISNDFFNFSSRGTYDKNGTPVTKVGIRIDNAGTNAANNRFFGGTFEGATQQQLDIVGADNTLVMGTHLESLAPVSIGNVTFPANSRTITGSDFSAGMVGKYVRRNDDTGATTAAAWTRVCKFNSPTSLDLCDVYQGTMSDPPTPVPASIVAGNIRIADNATPLSGTLSVTQGMTEVTGVSTAFVAQVRTLLDTGRSPMIKVDAHIYLLDSRC